MTGTGDATPTMDTLDDERSRILYDLVVAWWNVPPDKRQDFEARRIGGNREPLFHPGFAGNSIDTPPWPLLRLLEDDGYLSIRPGRQAGTTVIGLRAPAFAYFDAVNAPPQPPPAQRRPGFRVPEGRRS